jgi:BirA family transcriptional regulator, biotin operon repressor / biotin---[acetyl-CoA-carboxylase] ligase
MKAASTDRLTALQLRAALGDCVIGREIVVLEQTTSTNDSVLQRATPVQPEGLTIFAERQTAGRGQRNNRWESAASKGLWFSILLRPNIEIGQSIQLTRWSADTIARTIAEQFNVRPAVKEPNDVCINGKKVAGVLVEMRAQKQAAHFAILGIGINVNHSNTDFSAELPSRAVSLAQILGRQVDRQALAVALLRNLDRSYSEIFRR